MRTPIIMQLTLVLSLSLSLGAANAAILASRSSSSLASAQISSVATHTDMPDAHASPSPTNAMNDNLLDKLAHVQNEETSDKSSPVAASPMASMRVVPSQVPSQSVELLATVSSSISAAEPTTASASAGSHAQPLTSEPESDSSGGASSTSSESSTSNSVAAVPFTNIVAPPPPTAMASETRPYTGNPALGLVATASTPQDNANAKAISFPASHTSGQPFKEIAHVSSAPEAPPKAPAAGAGTLDDEPDPVEDSSGPIGRNICIGIFTFLTLAAIVTCFKDKLNGAYRRFRQHRNARETAFVNPWTPMADTDSEKGVAIHSEKDEMLNSARTSVYGAVHPLSPGGPVSPAASSNYSPSVMQSHTVPTYNRWPNQAPPVSTESLASEMTDYGRFPMPPTHPDYRYGPYVAKPQPDYVYYR